MSKKLVGHGVGAGPRTPIDWSCDGCGWSRSAASLPDPTKVPADVQADFDAHHCEGYESRPFEHPLANFRKVDFPPEDADLPAPGEGYVYVFCWKANGADVPFYVGQTERLRGRMGDYQSAQFAACTDFRVGEAIRYLREERGLCVVVLYRKSDDPRHEEYTLIRDLQLAGLRLLNSLPSYDYRKADRNEEQRTVRKFCEMLLANQPA
jgi:hypothetical protein